MSKRKLLIFSDDSIDYKNIEFVRLFNPRTSQPELYLWDSARQRLLQLQKAAHPHRTWIADDETVSGGGDFFMCQTFDPLFLLLPIMMQSTEKFRTLDDIVLTSEHPELLPFLANQLDKLSQLVDLKKIPRIGGDAEGIGSEMTLYRGNLEKIRSWSLKKLKNLQDFLDASPSFKSSLVENAASKSEVDEKIIFEAISILSDNLPLELENWIMEHFELNAQKFKQKSKKEQMMKQEIENSREFQSQKAKDQRPKSVKQSRADSFLKKDKENQSIMNFFKKT